MRRSHTITRRLMIAALGLAALPLSARADTLAEMRTGRQPGCATALIGESGVTIDSAGFEDIESGRPISGRSRFLIASASKQFTALAVLTLVDAGQLALDAPAANWLPEFSGALQGATVRQLLNQTAGVRDHTTLMALAGVERLGAVAPEAILTMMRGLNSGNFTPGSRAGYSNGNFLLLAQLVERVSHQSLTDYADAAIFKPLAMTDTGFASAPGMAHGYRPMRSGGFAVADDQPSLPGSGGLVTTVEDLVRFDAAFRSGKGPLTSSVRAAFTSPGRLSDGSEAVLPEFGTPYGAGVGLELRNGILWFSHDGGSEGFRAQYTRQADVAHAAVVICNRVDVDPDEIADALLDRTQPPAPKPNPSPAHAYTPLRSEALAPFVGRWRSSETSIAYDIRATGSDLEVTITSPLSSEPIVETWGGLKINDDGGVATGPLRLNVVAGQLMVSFGRRIRNLAFERLDAS